MEHTEKSPHMRHSSQISENLYGNYSHNSVVGDISRETHHGHGTSPRIEDYELSESQLNELGLYGAVANAGVGGYDYLYEVEGYHQPEHDYHHQNTNVGMVAGGNFFLKYFF